MLWEFISLTYFISIPAFNLHNAKISYKSFFAAVWQATLAFCCLFNVAACALNVLQNYMVGYNLISGSAKSFLAMLLTYSLRWLSQ